MLQELPWEFDNLFIIMDLLIEKSTEESWMNLYESLMLPEMWFEIHRFRQFL